MIKYAPIDKRPKSSPFHGGVRGSNPLGSTTNRTPHKPVLLRRVFSLCPIPT